MAKIATVAAITGNGTVFAVDAQGASRQLKVGDILEKGETVRTVGDAHVELMMDDGRLLAVEPLQSVRLDENVVESDQRPTAQDSAVTTPATADTVIQALERGTDLSTQLEATAAGLGGGGGSDGGSTFVQLLRITEGVGGQSYAYSFTPPDLPPDLQTVPEDNTPPTMLVGDGELFATSAEAPVYEAAIRGGSNEAGLGEFVEGKFLVSDQQGVATLVSVTINGVVIPMGSLVGAEVPGANGILTIKSFDPATGLATFEYELKAPTVDVPNQAETEVFTFSTTDGTFTSNTATITLNIVDDVPTAAADSGAATEGGTLTVAALSGVLANDVVGADVSGTVTTTGDFEGQHGTLTLNADGSYTYVANASVDAGETDSFTYTMKDADGDESTATLTITFSGDNNAPTAQDSAAQVSEVDLRDGGTADVSGQLTFSTGADAPASVVVNNDAALGTVSYNSETNTWTYTLNGPVTDVNGAETPETDHFTYTVTDSDGSVATGTITITINDDVPTIAVSATAAADALVVDESALHTVATANFADNFSNAPSYGADGAAATDAVTSAYTLSVNANTETGTGLVDSVSQEAVVLSVNGSGAVEGKTAISGELVFTVSVDGSGMVTLDQSRAVMHDTPTLGDTSEPVTLSATDLVTLTRVDTITDRDGDTSTGSASINIGTALSFKDDGPAITVTAKDIAPDALVVDESALHTVATANFADNFSNAPSYGADGAAATDAVTSAYTLSVNANTETGTGLVDSLTQQAVVLSVNGSGAVEGKTATSGELVFTVSVDGSGMVTLDQSRAVMHDTPTLGDTSEPVTLSAADLVTLTRVDTITDRDGDTSTGTDSINIGTALSFKDDGPSITVSAVAAADALVVDESALHTVATANFADNFSNAPSYGADGAAATNAVTSAYTLSVKSDAVDSGLVDTVTGDQVLLRVNGSGEVEGYTAAHGNAVVFTLSVNTDFSSADFGKVTLDQSRAMVQPDGTAPDTNEAVTLKAADLITLTRTDMITDRDGDTSTGSGHINIGQALSFQDDGPTLTVSANANAGTTLGTLSIDETVNATVDHFATGETVTSYTTDDVAGLGRAVTSVSGGLTGLFTVTSAAGSDGTQSAGGTLSFVGVPTGGLATNLSATNGGAITLYMDGQNVVGKDATNDVVFRIELVDVAGVKQIQTTLYEALNNGANSTFDESTVLKLTGEAALQLQYSYTLVDGDGDSISKADTVSLATAQTSAFSFQDDGPTFISADHGILANTAVTSVTGDLLVTYGADGAAGSDQELSLVGNTAPTGLSSGGLAVSYFVDTANPDLLIAYTGSDHTTNQVFTLQLTENGTYTFTVLQAVDALETVPIGSSTSFGSGPTGYQILTDVAGSGATPLAMLSGWQTTSGFSIADFNNWLSTGTFTNTSTAIGNANNDTVQAAVNGSTAGWGIDNNNLDGGTIGDTHGATPEVFRVDFHDSDLFDGFNPSFNGPQVFYATLGLSNFLQTDTVAYVVHYENTTTLTSGQGTVGTIFGTDNINMFGDGTHYIDYIEFMALTGNGKFDLVDVQTKTNTGTANLNFNVTVMDGDGDTTSGPIAITLDGSTSVINGTLFDDSIAGNGLSNTLSGLAGSDTLWGNGGADTFVWHLADAGTTIAPAVDTVKDFGVGDVLQINDLLSTAGAVIQGTQTASSTTLNIADTAGHLQSIVLEGYGSSHESLASIISKLTTDHTYTGV